MRTLVKKDVCGDSRSRQNGRKNEMTPTSFDP